MVLVYYNSCVIREALDYHWVHMLGDVSSDLLVCLDHIDQGNCTRNKHGCTEWTALSCLFCTSRKPYFFVTQVENSSEGTNHHPPHQTPQKTNPSPLYLAFLYPKCIVIVSFDPGFKFVMEYYTLIKEEGSPLDAPFGIRYLQRGKLMGHYDRPTTL